MEPTARTNPAPPKIFATGCTGYVGGDALYALVDAHPQYDITCLVRDSDKGAQIASQYSRIRLVYGTLDDSNLLEEEAKKADIVLNFASSDHEGAVKALIAGLVARPSTSPGYLIHTSGTGILCFSDTERQVYGEASTKIYDDWEGVSEVTNSIPDTAWHRNVDKIVLAAGSGFMRDRVKTAIVCPPTIYGPGRGPGNKRSFQLPELAKAILQRGKGFMVGAGKATWNCVNVSDLSVLYVGLIEHAVRGEFGKVSWGTEGYYFAENGEFQWGDISRRVTMAAYNQKLIASDDVVSISAEEANIIVPGIGASTWGTNSRCRAIRARKQLLWKPQGKSIVATIADVVKNEARRLKMVEGHAKKAAGKA